MPKNTKVLNVSLTDNTCYVNLDSGFISGDIDMWRSIFRFTRSSHSLTEPQTVNKVQITVNGSADVTYRNVISLVQPLEREEKYIVK
ncbi:MAG: GerMN domain-containing protein [Clostridium fessum]